MWWTVLTHGLVFAGGVAAGLFLAGVARAYRGLAEAMGDDPARCAASDSFGVLPDDLRWDRRRREFVPKN